MKTKCSILLLIFTLSTSISFAQDEPLIGEIKMFAGNFAPRGWAFCDGQLLPISQNSALFSILGTNYGGDGRTTFGLPDLRGRTSVHAGRGPAGPGLVSIRLGQKGGSETTELRKGDVFEDASGKSSEAFTVKKGDSRLYTRGPYLGVNYIIALVGIYPSRS